MLIPKEEVIEIILKHGFTIKGILHIGAHTCEEITTYAEWGVSPTDIIWVDANDELTQKNIARGIPNCYTAVLDEVERDATFHIANNMESSSLLEFGTHSQNYTDVVFTHELKVKTEPLWKFFHRTNLAPAKYNVWNLDIQGSELSVLKGSPELLQYADVLYLEVNTEEVYKNNGTIFEIDAFLKDHTFERVYTMLCGANWGDAIYVRK